MIVQWQDEYLVGHPAIDADHRLVVNILNELAVALSVGAPAEVVGSALNALARSVEGHFQREESRFCVLDPAEARLHRRQHEELVQRIRRMQNGSVDHRSLSILGLRWLSHIDSRDQALWASPVASIGVVH